MIVLFIILALLLILVSVFKHRRHKRIDTQFPIHFDKKELGFIRATQQRFSQYKFTTRTKPGLGFIVFLGDSVASGEAGRWAGNSLTNVLAIDVSGEKAYYDNDDRTGERIAGCHRSNVLMTTEDGTRLVNMAWSGAMTSSRWSGEFFKPGLDFYDDKGQLGHAIRLEQFAKENSVKMVVVSIGGNDFRLSRLLEKCMLKFLSTPWLLRSYGREDPEVLELLSRDNIKRVVLSIYSGLENLVLAMIRAGYGYGWTLVVQTYPSILPEPKRMMYPEFGYGRYLTGGCAFYNADLEWINSVVLKLVNNTILRAVRMLKTALPRVRVKIIRLDKVLIGHRLCEKGVDLIENTGFNHWSETGAKEKLEWVNQAKFGGAFHIKESLHPNYWAQNEMKRLVLTLKD